MKNCFLSYDYTCGIFDIHQGKSIKGKVTHTFSATSNLTFRHGNKKVYQCCLQIISYYQNKGYTVYFDEFIARIFDELEPIFKNGRDIQHERSLVETTVIQID